jgi:hypothetical protein
MKRRFLHQILLGDTPADAIGSYEQVDNGKQ